MREAGIALRALLDFTRQQIVGLARLVAGGLGVVFGLHARPRHGEHATFDAGFVHGLEPHLAEIGKPPEKRLAFARRQVCYRRPPIVLQAGKQTVLLDRNLLDHCSCPLLSLPYSR